MISTQNGAKFICLNVEKLKFIDFLQLLIISLFFDGTFDQNQNKFIIGIQRIASRCSACVPGGGTSLFFFLCMCRANFEK